MWRLAATCTAWLRSSPARTGAARPPPRDDHGPGRRPTQAIQDPWRIPPDDLPLLRPDHALRSDDPHDVEEIEGHRRRIDEHGGVVVERDRTHPANEGPVPLELE